MLRYFFFQGGVAAAGAAAGVPPSHGSYPAISFDG
jgi:hypothetical protein